MPNPNNKFQSYAIKHVLCAFEKTIDACTYDVNSSVGPVGTQFSGGCGKAVVLVNEVVDQTFMIYSHDFHFNFFSSLNSNTTSQVGTVAIADKTGTYFLHFLREQLQNFDVSISHATFVLKTLYNGDKNDGDTSSPTNVDIQPAIFNVTDVMFSLGSLGEPNSYMLNYVSTYNTFGLIPEFSDIYQMTITNESGNLHKEIPKPDPVGSSIKLRAEEDAEKNGPRKTRLDKSKTMETLNDVFKAFRIELMEQKYEHKRQLQEWISYIVEDYVKKIAPPKQKKPTGELPVDYIVELAGKFKAYKVDNRNLLFEQPEQKQEKVGIRSITIPPGMHLTDAIDHLMKLSKQVGRDYEKGTPTSYKINICVVRKCSGRYDVFIVIKDYIIPKNDPSGADTGPGEGGDNPLELIFQEAGVNSDNDIMTMSGLLRSEADLTMMEKQIEGAQAQNVLGDKEQQTAERSVKKDYFKTLFSGVRTMINNENNGLEFSDDASKVDNSRSSSVLIESTTTKVFINGNPFLMSDLCRNPWEVAQNIKGPVNYYSYPEYYPMYMKVLVKIAADNNLGNINDPKADAISTFYHEKYYHMVSVHNQIINGAFTQTIELLRTDDVM